MSCLGDVLGTYASKSEFRDSVGLVARRSQVRTNTV